MKRRMAVGLTLIFTFLGVWWINQTNKNGRVIDVQTAQAQVMDISSSIETIGVIQPANQYNIMTEVAGKVAEVFVHEGEKVEKGQILFRLDSSYLQSQLEQAKVALEIEQRLAEEAQTESVRQKAELAVAMAQGPGTDYESFTGLMDEYRELLNPQTGASVPVWGDESEKMEETSNDQINQEKVKLAQMKIDELTRQIENYTVKSLMTGEVLVSNVKVGEVVTPGVPVMVVGNLQQMIVKASIGENDIARVNPGQEVEISGEPLNGITLKGRILRVKPIVNRFQNQQVAEAMGEVEIGIEETDYRLIPGVSVEVNITCESGKNKLVVPIEALLEDDAGSFIYVVEGGRAVKKEVKTAIRNELFVEITEGLEEGETVIFNPGEDIFDGVRVNELD